MTARLNLRLVVLAGFMVISAGVAFSMPVLYDGSGTNPVSGQELDATAQLAGSGGCLDGAMSDPGAGTLAPTDILTADLGEWAHEAGLSGAPGGASHGIHAPGSDLFGDPTTGNKAVTGGGPLIHHSIGFTSGAGGGWSDPSLNDPMSGPMSGPADDPSPVIPEPTTMALLLAGGIAFIACGWARRRLLVREHV